MTKSVDQSLLDGNGNFIYCFPLKLFSVKKSVLVKLTHFISLLQSWTNLTKSILPFLGGHLLKDGVMHFKWHLVKCHFWFQPPAAGLLADKLRKIFDESWERGNTAMKEFSYCCHFQITSEWTTIIYNMLFNAIKFQTGYRIFIKLPTQKVCYEDPGNKNDWFMKKLVC